MEPSASLNFIEPKVHYLVNNSPQMIYPVPDESESYLSKIHFNIILPSTYRSS
jgi:hypothetical protein